MNARVRLLDTYLLLLGGHGSGGEVLESHNNLRGDATELDEVYLAAGDYTVEATTALSNATGGYRIDIDGDFAVRDVTLPAAVTATVGQSTTARFAYKPADAAVSVQSITPTGLDAVIEGDGTEATLELTPDKARTTTVTLAFTASRHTTTHQITVTSYCQTGYRASPDGTCLPLTPTLDEACFQSRTEGRTDNFGRQWRDVTLRELYATGCASASVARKSASYVRFDIPSAVTSRSTYEIQIDVSVPANARPFGGVPRPGVPPLVPEFSVTVWRLGPDGASADAAPLTVTRSASSSGGRGLRFLADVGPGSYVIEAAVPAANAAGNPPNLRTANRFIVAVATPSGRQMQNGARQLGNIGRDGAGASLGQFLDDRASLDYNAHPIAAHRSDPDNAFDPDSPTYPWLVFTTDRCSIPPRWVLSTVEAAIVELFTAHLPVPVSLDLVQEQYLVDRPMFGNATVQFVYGCMRHDFNWRNHHRIHHHIGFRLPGGAWSEEIAKEANLRLKNDLEALCDANREGAPENHRHFDWEITTDRGNALCKTAARTIRTTLDLVVNIGEPLSFLPVLGIDYPHDG